ncbi:MAG: SRPBCC domain-containing protein [Polyangiaceae bacterium]|nr:SRPBCC domain-containing protein [Polyangiaceae bacterium]MCW5790555.1 SRPBCC domain-containing protein [Polyangiaceae bacterium]
MELKTEIEIDAPPSEVWGALTHFEAYPTWNPVLTTITGPLEVGARLSVTVAQPGGHEMRWRPTITRLEPERELRWLGRLLFRGLFDGEQFFQLTRLDGERTRLVHGERFSGLLAARYASRMASTARGFAVMNGALKRRVEQPDARRAGKPAVR